MVAQSRQPSLQETESEELTWAKKKKNHILTLSQKKIIYFEDIAIL